MVYSFLFLVLMILLSIYVNKNLPALKGRYGERVVGKILNRLDSAKYTIYHDLYIPAENNKTTQIDHLVTSPYGIFVIETKHYNGWIFGNEKSRYWTQVIYKRKEKLFNPIWQNAGHIKALENYLEIDKNLFSSIIAFSNQSTFKFKEEFTRAEVIHFPELIQTITKNNERIISDDELRRMNQLLDKLIITDKKVKKETDKAHVEAIKTELAKEKTAQADKSKCPKCSSELVKRNGKYGSFIGCSNYPKCRFTRKIG